MADQPFRKLQASRPDNSSSSPSSTNPHHLVYASQRAQVLFGSYRRGDANDPERYVAAIAAVLAHYDAELIREVTDPNTGIQTTEKYETWLPNVGELKRYCDGIIAHRQNLARLGPPRQPVAPLPRPEALAGDMASCHVPHTHAKYPSLLEWSVTANPRCWRMGVNSDGVPGIWIDYGTFSARFPNMRGAA
jgi:hypothetical protein